MPDDPNQPPQYPHEPDPNQPYGQQPPAEPYYGQPGYGQQQPYGYGPPGFSPAAPYGVHPMTGIPYSDKSKLPAGLLQLLLPFVGICGIGRLYTGHIAIGLTQLIGMFVGYALMFVLVGFLVVPAIWLWTVIDGIVMLVGEPRDSYGRPLRS